MKINKTTIHITASNPDATIADIRRIHKANGWSDIGYHWLVDKYGVIHKGRDESLTGAHVGGHNSGNIGISYIARGANYISRKKYLLLLHQSSANYDQLLHHNYAESSNRFL